MRDDAIRRCCEALAARADADAVAAAFTEHLASVTVGALPAAAQQSWRDVARLMKAPADKPIPAGSIALIRSWPAARIADLLDHIRKADAILDKLENERLEDEIRDNIRRHYL